MLASVLTTDLLWVFVKGAVSGYQSVWENPIGLMGRVLSFMKKYDDDAVFLTLFAVACIVIPIAIWLWRRFLHQVRALLRTAKQAKKDPEMTQNEGDEDGQKAPAQDDQGTESFFD